MAPTLNIAVPPAPTFGQRGFTLIELTIVLFIVTLLVGAMLMPLSAQRDLRSFGDTQKILADTRDALLGFAIANERLPCPARYVSPADNSAGQESICDDAAGPCVVTPLVPAPMHGRCSNPNDGFIPAVTLGLAPIDAQGYLLDGWGGDAVNRLRYALSATNSNAFSKQAGMKGINMSLPDPDSLKICSTGVGMINPGTLTADCAVGAALATDAVAVIYSLGKNAGTGGAGAAETHNPNPQATVLADPAFVNTPQGANFDDQMIWLSKNTLFNRMVAAGRLP
jgi:prepilin-type N-terminal cleavage/methylation domain-containing protein